MPTYRIRGIDVDFPFEAYDCQIVYMEKVIQSLQERCNALLESPTGTGKTLCLLCATLAWRKSLGSFSTGVNVRNSQKEEDGSDISSLQSSSTRLPAIVYATRTHSQLRQVIQELKRTSYRPKMVVLGSREQLCIHEEVSLLRGRTQTNACRSLCQKRGKRYCKHYSRVTEYMKSNSHLGDDPIDIEDLVNVGKNFGPCPYYLSRELHKAVDILFAPYNYLIDRGNRKSLSLQWQNSVLIFDEAHNLESICADAASFDLPSWLLTACISEANNCIDLSVKRREESNDKSTNPDNFAILRALLLKLEKRIAEVPIGSKEMGFTRPGPYIYELLGELNITHETASKLKTIIEDAAVLLEEDKQLKMQGTVCRLESLGDILDIIFREKDNVHAAFYKVHVQEVEASTIDGFKGMTSRTLSWWCFNPGTAMETFSRMGVGSIILTSGTLSPLDSFAQELKLDFPVRLENPHVISSNQIWAGVVPTGPSGSSFNSSYRNRDSIAYKQDLGNAIVNLARIVPDGLLVFFPSYYFLEQCIGCWKDMNHASSTTIWERICKHKKPVIEPRQSSLFASSIEDYMSKLKDTSASGAVFFAVCRGKVSEGLDFADHAGRAVVITGIPFASRTDPKIRLKREYLDQQAVSQRERSRILMGEEWYNQQASRAVNQAVGRVIRHRHDYGAIIFCDERFAHSSRQSQMSLWIQPHVKCYAKFGDVVYTLTRFFRDGGARVSTKSSLIKSEDMDRNPKSELDEELNRTQPRDTPSCSDISSSDNFGSLTTLMNTARSLTSIPNMKTDFSSSQWGEIVPANRSTLNPCNNPSSTAKCSNALMCSGKRMQLLRRKNLQSQNREIIDLIDNSILDEKSSKEPTVACDTKKRKSLSTVHDLESQRENFLGHSSYVQKVELDNLPVKKVSVKLEPVFDSITMEKNETEFFSQKNKGANLNPVPRSDEETKGSSFLVQVKEKLSVTEYKEFVGLMKALKSKAMTIGQVLQSIVTIFSLPDRRHLLRSFKDYIPAKYHSLYEQYLEPSDQH